MKYRRGLFIGSLMVLFLCCFHVMNQHYDELARYQYVNDDNRKLILEYMSTEDINFLIDRQYKPEEFMEYLGMEDFNIRLLDCYNLLKEKGGLSNQEIIQLANTMRDSFDYAEFKKYCANYSNELLYQFFMCEEDYVHERVLVLNPYDISKIESTETLFTYEPSDLVKVEGVPMINSLDHEEEITLTQKASEGLVNMCLAAYELNEKTCGNMIVTQGYLSFTDQEKIYEEALLTYGLDDVLNYVDYPGQSIFQLGNVIKLVPAAVEKAKDDEISAQQIWLVEHASDFGFKFLNDSSVAQSQFILQFDEDLLTDPEESVE